MYWQISYNDIKEKIKLHISEKQAGYIQEFQTLAKVVSMAFGGGSKDEKVKEATPANFADAQARLNALLGRG